MATCGAAADCPTETSSGPHSPESDPPFLRILSVGKSDEKKRESLGCSLEEVFEQQGTHFRGVGKSFYFVAQATKSKLSERFDKFEQGEWMQLIRASIQCDEDTKPSGIETLCKWESCHQPRWSGVADRTSNEDGPHSTCPHNAIRVG